jgi:predicted type IV restriction endonuclease
MDTALMQKYVESAQSAIEDSPQMQEATTKASLLNEFVSLLGWEIPMNTKLEYSVKAFGKTHKVDYALLLGGQPRAFLEAKGLDTTLTSKHRNQLADYLRGENVTWGILTNGKKYEFYQRRVTDEKVAVEAVEQTTLQHLPSKSRVIEAYRAETIQDEESEIIIEHIRELQNSLETLTSEKDELAAAVVNTLTDSVSEAIESEAETQAKEMIDKLAADIESEINIDVDTPSDSGNGDSVIKPGSEADASTVTGEYCVKIAFGNDTEVFGNSVQSDLMASVVNYLIQNHDLISAIEPLPYIPGNKRAIVNDKPTHNGDKMKSHRELNQGYYLEVNLSWNQKKREMKRMAGACGVEISIAENNDD